MKISSTMTVVMAVATAFSAVAAERVYTQGGDSRGFVHFPVGDWLTGDGTFQPGDDVVYRTSSAVENVAHFVAVTNAHTTFGSLVTTNLDVTLEFADWKTGAGEIGLTDLSDWSGTLWFFRPDTVRLAQSTVIRRLRASGRARLTVADGAKVVVSNLVGRGTLKTEGAGGELELVRTSGDLAGIHFSAGDLTLHGEKSETTVDVAEVLKRAVIHLDAQDAASLTLENGRVRAWRDPTGGGQAVQQLKSAGAPYQSYIDIPLPAYVADYNGSGKPVVDFGPYRTTNEIDFAISGASSLKFVKGESALRDNASHVFLVFADNDDLCRGTPFNDSYNPVFQRASYTDGAVRNNSQTKLSVLGSLASYGKTAHTGRDAAYNGYPVQSMFQFGGRQLKISEMDYRRADNTTPSGEKRVGALARSGFDCWGGVVIGEIIVFSDEDGRKVSLSDAERAAVNDYLRRKWLPPEEQPKIALNELFCGESCGVIRVPEGDTVRVRHCISAKDRLVKDGPGALLVGDFSTRKTVVVDVKDGAFGFAARSDVSTATPAHGARHHFDADAAADAIETETVGDVRFVTRWWDKDPDHKAAVPVINIATKTATDGSPVVLGRPEVQDGLLNGRRGISLGTGRNLDEVRANNCSDASALIYETLRGHDGNRGRDGDFREGFAVVRFRSRWFCNAFGTDTVCQNMVNMGNDARWAHPDALGASVAWNGVPHDLQDVVSSHCNEFGVLRFSCGDAQPVNAIGLDRYAPGGIGGLDICEYITYDRILTDRERIDTEAYLMKKWLDRDHPLEDGPQVAEVRFASGRAAKLVAEADATVGVVDAPSGDLMKSGEGRLVAGVRSAQLTGDLKVSAGSLALTEGPLAHALAKAAFHVDASDVSTVITNAESLVTQWNDVRGADVFFATNWEDWPGAKPTVAVADCNGRNTVDFGTCNYANGDGIGWSKPEGKAACAAVTDGSGLKWKGNLHLVEGYQVFRLNEGKTKPPIVGGTSTCHFHPDDTYIISQKPANIHSDIMANTGMWIDDATCRPFGGGAESAWATYGPTDGYRLYGFAVTNLTAATYPVGGAFAYERHQKTGGLRLAEGIYFSQPLTEEERQAVMGYLRHKWQAFGDGIALKPLSIEVAKGASLALDGIGLSAASYCFEIDGDGAVGTLNVRGTLDFGEQTILTLCAPKGFRFPTAADEMSLTLFTADAVAVGGRIVLNVDECIRQHAAVRLDLREKSVGIKLFRKGLVFVVR